MARSAIRPQIFDLVGASPARSVELESVKLDRLRELRATIDALRTEQTADDPLLAWVMQVRSTDDP
jgi:hypothetical protein